MLKALVMAFSFYTRLPMPYIKDPGKSGKYILSFFPVTGVVLGALQVLTFTALCRLSLPVFFTAVAATVIPLIYTGGIHIDGFMDTTDALRSYKSKEEKIGIMDDPHSGAFSIIALVIYVLISTALYHTIFSNITGEAAGSGAGVMIMLGLLFVMSRSLSSLTCYIFPKAKKSGMLYDITDGAGADAACHSGSLVLPLLMLSASAAVQVICLPVAGLINILFQVILLIYYRWMCMKQFGGVTGDTAGWYLCKSETAGLFSIVVYMALYYF